MSTIERIVTRPNGVILHLDAWPHKLAIIGCAHPPEVGQRVEVGDDSALITSATVEGHAGIIRSYQRSGLRLYERNQANVESYD